MTPWRLLQKISTKHFEEMLPKRLAKRSHSLYGTHMVRMNAWCCSRALLIAISASARCRLEAFKSALHLPVICLASAETPNRAALAPSPEQELGRFYAERIPFETLLSPADEAFRDFLARCLRPLKLVLFTNSPRTYANRVLQALQLDAFFPHGRVFAVEDVLPLCKPQPGSFTKGPRVRS